MKKLLKKSSDSKNREDTKSLFIKPDEPFYSKDWVAAGFQQLNNDFGTVFLKETTYRLDYQHGKYKLGQFYDALAMWESYDEAHPIKITSDDHPIFYDTETTGLKGVGTHIFLNGLLEESSVGFTLKQYVLADPSNEAAFLFESRFWQGEKTVITYNGKSFDWPQLQTRWTLNRQELPSLREHHQIDLFHISKRIWKNDLSRMKLSNVEVEKLDFHRVDDMPGYLAPIVYLDAVRSGETSSLFEVLRHNEYDLLSLITLFIQATELVFSDVTHDRAIVHTNIGKWYTDLKQRQRGTELLEGVVHQYSEYDAAMANYLLAFDKKKDKAFQEAESCLLASLPYLAERQNIIASIELAKLYEHKLKDIQQAQHYTLQALFKVKASRLWKVDAKNNKIAQLEKRYIRLKKKEL